jgi:hypothetical protein
MSTRLRRMGFGAALATGASLVALSFGGMASLDGELRAAAQQVQTEERVRVDERECKRPHRSDRDI